MTGMVLGQVAIQPRTRLTRLRVVQAEEFNQQDKSVTSARFDRIRLGFERAGELGAR